MEAFSLSLDITFLHLIIMLLTIAVVIFGGIYVARAVKSAEGYSLGGRSASFPLVAGSIAGTVIGNIHMTWLTGGVPDGADEDELMEIAEDKAEFERIAYLFGNLVCNFR